MLSTPTQIMRCVLQFFVLGFDKINLKNYLFDYYILKVT